MTITNTLLKDESDSSDIEFFLISKKKKILNF